MPTLNWAHILCTIASLNHLCVVIMYHEYPFMTDTFYFVADVKVNTTAANLLNNIPSLKLSATDVLRVLHDGIYFNSNNNIHHTNFVRQTKVLEDVIDSIKAIITNTI